MLWRVWTSPSPSKCGKELHNESRLLLHLHEYEKLKKMTIKTKYIHTHIYIIRSSSHMETSHNGVHSVADGFTHPLLPVIAKWSQNKIRQQQPLPILSGPTREFLVFTLIAICWNNLYIVAKFNETPSNHSKFLMYKQSTQESLGHALLLVCWLRGIAREVVPIWCPWALSCWQYWRSSALRL